MLSEAQDWALRGIGHNNGYITASRLGSWMLKRPGFDTTGKKYSPYTLGRMGGGMLMHLRNSGMVKTRTILGKRVGALTPLAKQYLSDGSEDDKSLPSDLANFIDEFL